MPFKRFPQSGPPRAAKRSAHLDGSRGQIEPAPVRLVVITMMNRHCDTIPVVEGDARLNGMVMVRDVLLSLSRSRGMRLLRFNNRC
jgi:hypothetical protein